MPSDGCRFQSFYIFFFFNCLLFLQWNFPLPYEHECHRRFMGCGIVVCSSEIVSGCCVVSRAACGRGFRGWCVPRLSLKFFFGQKQTKCCVERHLHIDLEVRCIQVCIRPLLRHLASLGSTTDWGRIFKSRTSIRILGPNSLAMYAPKLSIAIPPGRSLHCQVENHVQRKKIYILHKGSPK